jgi:hypothetical protein
MIWRWMRALSELEEEDMGGEVKGLWMSVCWWIGDWVVKVTSSSAYLPVPL